MSASADTRTFGRPPDLTPEQTADAATDVLRAVCRRQPHPPRAWEEPPAVYGNTPADDQRHWLRAQCAAADRDRYELLYPERYGGRR